MARKKKGEIIESIISEPIIFVNEEIPTLVKSLKLVTETKVLNVNYTKVIVTNTSFGEIKAGNNKDSMNTLHQGESVKLTDVKQLILTSSIVSEVKLEIFK